MKVKNLFALALVTLMALLSGCASIPMASPEADAKAKTFEVAPGKAGIYVYRNEFLGSAVAMEVDLDGKQVGATRGMNYLHLTVAPGKHVITSHAENDDTVEITTVAGKNYYVWQEAKMGLMMARTKLHIVDEAKGQAGVNECKLVKVTQ